MPQRKQKLAMSLDENNGPLSENNISETAVSLNILSSSLIVEDALVLFICVVVNHPVHQQVVTRNFMPLISQKSVLRY